MKKQLCPVNAGLLTKQKKESNILFFSIYLIPPLFEILKTLLG
ncbi:hypothetical protein [Flavobacterium humidisoli]|nr:hypothetical protein [Flavobacterium humidisoli]